MSDESSRLTSSQPKHQHGGRAVALFEDVEELNARTGGASGLRYNVGRSCRGLRLTLRASTGSLWDHECHYVKARQECRTGANSRDNRTYAQYVLHDEIA
jgi:hypothetical protein